MKQIKEEFVDEAQGLVTLGVDLSESSKWYVSW